MNTKIVGMLVVTMLIITAFAPVVKSMNDDIQIKQIDHSSNIKTTTQNLGGNEQYGNWSEGGIDTFNSTTASVKLKLNILPKEIPIRLTGPTNVSRSIPENTSSGQWKIDTEIIQMDLVGTLWGRPVWINESPVRDSTGFIKQQQPGQDFPADSFFDVYVEIDTGLPRPFNKLHNKDPVEMYSEINDIPPYDHIYITTDVTPDIPLYTETGRRPVAWLKHANHTTAPSIEDPEIHIDIISPKNHYLYVFGIPFVSLPSDIPTIILGSVLIQVIAESGIGIEKVGFSIDGGTIQWDYYLPYMYIWTPPKEIGFHTITVTAYNTYGDSASQSMEVISAWFPGGYDE
jgi:hypothetical protein